MPDCVADLLYDATAAEHKPAGSGPGFAVGFGAD